MCMHCFHRESDHANLVPVRAPKHEQVQRTSSRWWQTGIPRLVLKKEEATSKTNQALLDEYAESSSSSTTSESKTDSEVDSDSAHSKEVTTSDSYSGSDWYSTDEEGMSLPLSLLNFTDFLGSGESEIVPNRNIFSLKKNAVEILEEQLQSHDWPVVIRAFLQLGIIYLYGELL